MISRRSLLRYSLGTAVAGSVLGSATAVAAPAPDKPSGVNISSSVKIRGANIGPRYAEVASVYQNNEWASMWGTWNWDGVIAPQLDDSAKIANAVRTVGSTLVMALGGITLSTYLARWEQFLDRAHSLGLYVYPCGGDLGHWGVFTREQSVETYSHFAKLLANYPNVIGVDIVNEANGTLSLTSPYLSSWTYAQPQPVPELLTELGSVVRSVGLPITYSRGMQDSSGWGNDYFTDHLGDFLDFHVYYSPAQTDSLEKDSNKQIVIGEFGVDQTVDSADRTARYNAVRAMCERDPRCVGALAWSTWDLASSPSLQFGLYDEHRQLRTDIAEPFLMFGGTR